MFKEPEKGNKDINIKRSEEALKTKSEIIAVACPFCNIMMSDGIKSMEKDISVLEEYLYLMCSKDNNAKEVAELGKKFHKYYLKYAKNTFLLDVLEKLNKKSLLLFSQNWSKLYTLEEIKNRHKKILDVLKSLDKENIENTIKDHYFETGSKIVLLR